MVFTMEIWISANVGPIYGAHDIVNGNDDDAGANDDAYNNHDDEDGKIHLFTEHCSPKDKLLPGAKCWLLWLAQTYSAKTSINIVHRRLRKNVGFFLYMMMMMIMMMMVVVMMIKIL